MAHYTHLGLAALLLSSLTAGCAVGVDDGYVDPVVSVEDTSSVPASPGAAEDSSARAGDPVYFGQNELGAEQQDAAALPPSYTFELVADANIAISLHRRTKEGPNTIGFTLHRVTGADNYVELGKAYGSDGSVAMSLYTQYGGTYAIRLLDGINPDSLMLQLECLSGTCAPRRQPGEVCGNGGSIACDKGLVCLYEAGTCNAPEEPGRCHVAPTACPNTFEPVCGCDGETWGNSCFAEQAGVSIQATGECK